jgi:hypothetical protein
LPRLRKYCFRIFARLRVLKHLSSKPQRMTAHGGGRSSASFGWLSGLETHSNLFSVKTLSGLLCKVSRRQLVLGTIVKRGAQPGAGTSLADLDNSRCSSLIGCYGISEHPFIASDNLGARRGTGPRNGTSLFGETGRGTNPLAAEFCCSRLTKYEQAIADQDSLPRP